MVSNLEQMLDGSTIFEEWFVDESAWWEALRDALEAGVGDSNQLFADTRLGEADGDIVTLNIRGTARLFEAGVLTFQDTALESVMIDGLDVTEEGNIEFLTDADDVFGQSPTSAPILLTGGGGIDILTGSENDDIIASNRGDDRIFALGGNDFVKGGAGNDHIEGGDGNDLLNGDYSDSAVHDERQGDEDWNDELFGGRGNDILYGNQGDDRLIGGAGDDLLFGGLGNDVFLRESGVDRLFGGDGEDTFQFDNRDTGIKTLADFEFGTDLATFRIDSNYFADTTIRTINNNQAHVSTVDDLIELVGAVLADDGLENLVSVEDGDLTLVIDADDHPRGDLTLIFENGATAIQTNVFEALVDAGVVPDGTVPPAPGGNGDGFIFNGVSSKGDDIYFATGGADRFRFESDEASEDGTRGTIDKQANVDVIIGFSAEDSLSFRIDGGFFSGLAENLPDVDRFNNNQFTFSADGIDELGSYLNALGESNSAFYDVTTNSTVLNINDDVPEGNVEDDLTIVLWNAGDLL